MPNIINPRFIEIIKKSLPKYAKELKNRSKNPSCKNNEELEERMGILEYCQNKIKKTEECSFNDPYAASIVKTALFFFHDNGANVKQKGNIEYHMLRLEKWNKIAILDNY